MPGSGRRFGGRSHDTQVLDTAYTPKIWQRCTNCIIAGFMLFCRLRSRHMIGFPWMSCGASTEWKGRLANYRRAFDKLTSLGTKGMPSWSGRQVDHRTSTLVSGSLSVSCNLQVKDQRDTIITGQTAPHAAKRVQPIKAKHAATYMRLHTTAGNHHATDLDILPRRAKPLDATGRQHRAATRHGTFGFDAARSSSLQ